MTNDNNSPNPTPIWRFYVPLLFQAALILAVPAQAIYTQLTGRTVILQTVPVDPYELLRGYSQKQRYDISSQESLRRLPGWQGLPKQLPNGNKLTFIKPGTRLYVILAEPAAPALPPELPQPWKPVAVSTELPAKLPSDRIALKGFVQNGSIQYGLETYYIPENQREEINADLRVARQANRDREQQTPLQANSMQLQQKPPVVMEIKVNAQGDAVPVKLWLRVGRASNPQIRSYRF